MRKQIAATEENRRSLKQRLMASLAMLLVALILATTSTYAWLVLSVAPEVTGITTNIGANGSLEIALLNKETFTDPNSVPTPGMGISLSNNRKEANNTWGNLVDLNDKSYGLQDITLSPARLNIKGTPGNYKVDRNENSLLIPSYGSDGRISTLTDKTVTGTYGENGFYSFADAEYGVRAIGSAYTYSVQSSALNQAKKHISTYTSSAISTAKSSVSGDAVQNLLISFAAANSFTQEDIDVLKAMIADLKNANDYIEDALRQGLVAMAASVVADETKFNAAKTIILNKETSISELLSNEVLTNLGYKDILTEFDTWVFEQEAMENNLNAADSACGQLDPATATKQDIKEVLDYLMNLDQVLVGEKNFSEITRDELLGMVSTGIELTLKPGSGIYATIADFSGNYTASISKMATMKTVSAENPSYLNALLASVNKLMAADGGSTAADVKLEALYGYVLDLAFRCNAFKSDLLLQTDGAQRVYENSESDSTMGGGSYMEFTTMDGLDSEVLTKLMNAVRVAFVDDAGNLLGIAKLNVSNRSVNEANGTVMAPLYLYDFEIGTDPLDIGKLIMGERRKTDNILASLERNMAKSVSTLVWLDGDTVDNTMVFAETNISGTLNLQFASSVDLMPVENSDLLGYMANKDGLNQAVKDNETFFSLGQRDYTTVSWNNYTSAYGRAMAVAANPKASDYLIYNSMVTLADAKTALQKVDEATFKADVERLRAWMGTADEDACLIASYNDGLPVLLTSYTQEQADNGMGWIKSVGYTDLRDEGNGLMTPIYTDDSWYNLANALYFAEALVARGDVLTDQEVDLALTRMELAYEALDFAVYFTAYELNGAIYYKATPADPENTDTYGTWYENDWEKDEIKRVISELKILELDAYAVETSIAYLYVSEWISSRNSFINPDTFLFDRQNIRGVQWSLPDGIALSMTRSQAELISDLYMLLRENHPDDSFVAAAKEMTYYSWSDSDGEFYEWFDPDYSTTYDEAVAVVEGLLALKAADDEANLPPADPNAVILMSPEQKIVLNKAILNAEEIANGINLEGIEDETEKQEAIDKKNALNEKKDAAQAILLKEGATYDEAQRVLDELNEQIAGYDPSKQATEYNTIQLSVPTSFGADDVEYFTVYDTYWVIENASAGSYTVSAVIITDGGVLCRVENTFTIYNEALGIKYKDETSTTAINVGETYALNLDWMFVDVIHCTETVDTVTYSSSDGHVLVWNGTGFTAVGAGTAKIYVTVETVQGNTYYTTYPVTITVEEPVAEEPVTP